MMNLRIDLITKKEQTYINLTEPGLKTWLGFKNHQKIMNPVVHFEMPADDRKRMADFYTSAFGWETNMLGEEMGNYVIANTGENDEHGWPKMPGTINGGFYPRKEDWPAQYPSIVIAVDDIEESMKKVTQSGGTVLGEPKEIPGVGLYVSFFDTEGNRSSILRPIMSK